MKFIEADKFEQRILSIFHVSDSEHAAVVGIMNLYTVPLRILSENEFVHRNVDTSDMTFCMCD